MSIDNLSIRFFLCISPLKFELFPTQKQTGCDSAKFQMDVHYLSYQNAATLIGCRSRGLVTSVAFGYTARRVWLISIFIYFLLFCVPFLLTLNFVLKDVFFCNINPTRKINFSGGFCWFFIDLCICVLDSINWAPLGKIETLRP